MFMPRRWRERRPYTRPEKLRVRRIDLVRFQDGKELVRIEFYGDKVAWIKPEQIETVISKPEKEKEHEKEEEERERVERFFKLLEENIEEQRRLRRAIEDLVNVVLKRVEVKVEEKEEEKQV